MRLHAGLFVFLSAAMGGRPAAADVPTYHGDLFRSGWDASETLLTPANVASRGFGRRFAVKLDGVSYGQPLVADAETTPAGVHSLVVVATLNDSVYALDATTGAEIWKSSLVPAGERPVPAGFTKCGIGKTYGVVSTPAIDRTRDAVYVVGVTLAHHSMLFRVHILSLATGAELQTPALIAASVRGPGGELEQFDADVQMQRPALAEANGNVYVAFGSMCDYNPKLYHGWLFAFDAASLAPAGVFISTPSKAADGTYYGGIWMGGNGPAVDDDGSLLFAVGNGTFDNATSFGDSVVRLSPDLQTRLDSFTPYTVVQDNANDADLGSGGTMLLPDVPGSSVRLAVIQGKDGILTLLDRAHLGGFTPGGPDNVLAELALGAVWSSPAYWQDAHGNEYVFTTGGPLYAIKVTRAPATLSVSAQTSQNFPNFNGNGATPTISSNGLLPNTGIAWIVRALDADGGELQLYAFAADDLTRTLLRTPLDRWKWSNVYSVPAVDAGSVFVAGDGVLYAFGLR